MPTPFRAQVYRDVAKSLREQALYAASTEIRSNMESIAHRYDLMAAGAQQFEGKSGVKISIGTGQLSRLDQIRR
jgi:hypothetical protein